MAVLGSKYLVHENQHMNKQKKEEENKAKRSGSLGYILTAIAATSFSHHNSLLFVADTHTFHREHTFHN